MKQSEREKKTSEDKRNGSRKIVHKIENVCLQNGGGIKIRLIGEEYLCHYANGFSCLEIAIAYKVSEKSVEAIIERVKADSRIRPDRVQSGDTDRKRKKE